MPALVTGAAVATEKLLNSGFSSCNGGGSNKRSGVQRRASGVTQELPGRPGELREGRPRAKVR
eukprot:1332488-Karenia_brevis.AAC.1